MILKDSWIREGNSMAAALLDAPNSVLPQLASRISEGRFTAGGLGENSPSERHLQQLLSAYVLRVRKIHADKAVFLELLRIGHVFGSIARYLDVDLRPEWRKLAANSPLAPLLLASVANPGVIALFDVAVARRPAEALMWATYALPWPEGAADPITFSQRTELSARVQRRGAEALLFSPTAAFFGPYWQESDKPWALRQTFVDWAAKQGWHRDFVAEGLARPRGGRPRFGVASANWREGTAIWRFRHDTLSRLRDEFDLVLVQLGAGAPPDTELFKEVVSVKWDGRQFQDAELVAAGLDVLYFPETYTGLLESALPCRRYAPLQLASYGIPVSTRAPHIDVFIGGAQVEPATSDPDLYSERLATAGPLGAWSPRRAQPEPAQPRDHRGAGRPPRVVCAANLAKWTPGLLEALQTIGRAGAEIVLLPNTQSIGGLLLKKQLDRALAGVPWAAHARTTPAEYLEILAGSDLAVDSFPYGGFTTLFDAMSFGIPVLSVEGGAAVSRSSAAAMRMAGLPTLACPGWQELAKEGVRLVQDPGALARTQAAVSQFAEEGVFAEDRACQVAKGFLRATGLA